MIARIWHGWTKPADAETYENLLRHEIFPSIAARNIKGYHGAELFIREDGGEVEFVTLLRFDSLEAVKRIRRPGRRQTGDLSESGAAFGAHGTLPSLSDRDRLTLKRYQGAAASSRRFTVDGGLETAAPCAEPSCAGTLVNETR
jgi:hypothetical protein